MATHTAPLKPVRPVRPKATPPQNQNVPQSNPQSARDRLLSALAESPRLNTQDAARINQAVEKAREASLGDDLSA